MLKTESLGLSSEEAARRRDTCGKNALAKERRLAPIFVFLKQFNSILIYILFAAAGISYAFGHMVDTITILAVVVVNAIVGFIQEYKAERSVNALREMIVPVAKVYRDGHLSKVSAEEIVPGDVLQFESGDRVPADARIVWVNDLRVDESALTGESKPSDKTDRSFSEKTMFADRRNMVWMGTFVTGGQARAVVTAIGSKTAIGSIAEGIAKIRPKKSHFEQKVNVLSRQMGIIAIAGAMLVFGIGFFVRGFGFAEIFLETIAVLVSGIPEGLPAVLTIVLAVSAVRMARKNAIVRSLPAVETLGVVTSILTDKTGTLTQNSMTVKWVMAGKELLEVTGIGWRPEGKFLRAGRPTSPLENPIVRKLMRIAGVCGNARVVRVRKKNQGEQYSIIGDPTEAALKVVAEKAGLAEDILEAQNESIDDMPFSSSLRYRATLVRDREKKGRELFVVGAPEAVMARCGRQLEKGMAVSMTDAARASIESRVSEWSSQALRVIALAYKEMDTNVSGITDEHVCDLVFVGLLAMSDPPREETEEAVALARGAGIRVIMATGDHKKTALAVAREVGIVEKEADETKESLVYTESELMELSSREFDAVTARVNVFARLTPKMKLRITKALQNRKQIVAVTGDGVNDALSLKSADVGISMGRIGTDAARESSKIVLADDNFASIVRAVEEGRIVFNNIRRASTFLVTTNFAEYATIVASIAFGLPLPLLPAQILWLNLVTEGLPDMAFAFEPSHGRALKAPPQNAKENILSRQAVPFLILMAVLMTALTIAVFVYFMPDGLGKAHAGAFAVMAWTQLFNIFNMRSLGHSVFSIGFFKNKYIVGAFIISVGFLIAALFLPKLQSAFQFSPLSVGEFLVLMVVSSSVWWLGELYKFVRNGRYKNM